MNIPAHGEPHPEPNDMQISYVVGEGLRQLSDVNAKADRGIKLVEVWNAGGAVAILSFMGAVPEMRQSCPAVIALFAFLSGILAIAITIALSYERARIAYERFSRRVASYYRREIGYADLWVEDFSKRVLMIPTIFAYLSLLGALIGTAAGLVAVLR